MKSVFYYSWNKSYYLRHPWRFIRETIINIQSAWERATKGYCHTDVWNMEGWFTEIIPDMLRTLAKEGRAYPGVEPFETPEKWEDTLQSMADVIESLNSDTWYEQNEYCDAFVEEPTEENRELFFMRQEELVVQHKELVLDTAKKFAEIVPHLWD